MCLSYLALPPLKVAQHIRAEVLQTYISKAGNFPFGNKKNRQKSVISSVSMASSSEAQPFLCADKL